MEQRALQEKPWARKKKQQSPVTSAAAENIAEGAHGVDGVGAEAGATLAEAMSFDSTAASVGGHDGIDNNASNASNGSTKRNREDISATPQKDGKKEANSQEEDQEKEEIRTPSPLDQGPTPYWKAMEDRGRGTSPKLTRSAAKKKLAQQKETEGKTAGFDQSAYANGAGGGDVLMFSPPDQVRNAERERREIRAKEDNRCVQIISFYTFVLCCHVKYA